MTSSIAIVGASLAGARAAQSLRKRGFDGRVLLIGAEAHVPYDRPPLSKDVLLGMSEPTGSALAPDGDWADQGIELELGQPVVALVPAERQVELADGRRFPADKVLLCTGGRPRRLDVPGAELPGVTYLRTREDAAVIREHLVVGSRVAVVGAGFIGAEVAASARSQGCDVTLIEVANVPLGRVLGEDLGRFYAEVHREHGVDLRLGVGVEAFAGDTSVRRVVLSDGTTVDADLVVVGVGLVPSTELAEQVGAAVGNGVLVNEYCETSIPDVYAAGDVANHPNPIVGERVRLEHWQNAQNQGVAAAGVMLGHREPFGEVPWFWSDQYGLNLQVAGHPGGADEVAWRGSPGSRCFSAFYLRGGELRAVAAVNRPKDVRGGMELIARSVPVSTDALRDDTVDLRALARAARSALPVPSDAVGPGAA